MRTILTIALLTSLPLGACKLGIGSEHVGQWRKEKVPKFDVCIEDSTGQCTEHYKLEKTEAARDFWGAQILWGNLGVASSSYQGKSETKVRGELGFEYLQGHGDKALGIRASVIGDSGFAIPITLLAHWGPLTRFSFFAGAGYIPYSRLTFLNDSPDNEQSLVGGRLLAGLKFVGSRYKNETRWIWTLEVDKRWVRFDEGTFDSHSLSVNVGPSF